MEGVAARSCVGDIWRDETMQQIKDAHQVLQLLHLVGFSTSQGSPPDPSREAKASSKSTDVMFLLAGGGDGRSLT